MADGTWKYPPLEQALNITGLWSMESYVIQRRTTIFNRVNQRPIFDLCQQYECRFGSKEPKWWWDQDGLCGKDG